ncbi:NAD(P)H-hydrate dehydratase [Roseobacter cerasinus]|nr:NAD(P)H-hydrate dehydratase [Roseobacter cerasinus]
MRTLEIETMAQGHVTGRVLMERAGRGVCDAVFEAWPDLTEQAGRACILCGPGNNGGDGYVVARLLCDRGWGVTVFALGDPRKLPPDARANHTQWAEMGQVRPIEEAQFDAETMPDLVVDALFGIGLTRALTAPLDRLAEQLAQVTAQGSGRVVAVDVPSGICADSGRALGAAVRADLTVTFHCFKPGHVLDGPERAHSSATVVKDIGLPKAPMTSIPGPAVALATAPAAEDLRKAGPAHKYTHGHAVVLSGPAGRTGAARLAARGALRIGAGLVTVAARADALPEVAAHQTAVMQRVVDDAADLKAFFGADTRANAFCAGPAMGGGAGARDMLAELLALKRPTVLDADALTLLSEDQSLRDALHGSCVLTPHQGEFARLFPDLAARYAAPPVSGPACSKLDVTLDAAVQTGSAILFKGAVTVIADPQGRAVVSPADDRTAWLATAGSGDVLAGFILGLMARGHAPFQAACHAVYLHCACARRFGPGLVAEDLPETLPEVFRALGV